MKYQSDSELMFFTFNEQTKKFLMPLILSGYGQKTKKFSSSISEELRNHLKSETTSESNIGNNIVVLFDCDNERVNEAQIPDKVSEAILSERESEVLTEIALGKRYREIAEKLFISINTVNYHKKNIYQKLNVHSQSEAVLAGLRIGII